MFGISWTVALSKNRVESYLAFWNPKKQKFQHRNWMRKTTLQKASQNALQGMKLTKKSNLVWRP
jgi:hypothetical protein